MVLEDSTMGGQHILALLLRDHTASLCIMCLMSLIFGSPLAANMLWNLREYHSLPLWALYCDQYWIKNQLFFLILNIMYKFVNSSGWLQPRVASNATGRGVLRLIQLQQRLNLLSVLIICMELVILYYPSEKMSDFFCIPFEGMFVFMLVNRQLSSIFIGLGRQVFNMSNSLKKIDLPPLASQKCDKNW